MSKFDMIIGYRGIKNELMQIADALKNREIYEKLGVSSPRGLLLYGEPGVGKSLMAAAIIEASGRNAFVCRKDQPNGDFVKHIKETFAQAMENAPSVVLLDDMDKFANGDERHPDAEEYVTVQSCIDNAKGKDVFVVATVNTIRNLPHSLRRPGRFDRTIEIEEPTGEDAEAIVAHFLKNKKIAQDVDIKTLARIMNGRSCAKLETIVNEAGLYAGFAREDSITMAHLLEACLRIEYGMPAIAAHENEICQADLTNGNLTTSQIAYHEAGHAVISELLCPGSVTLMYAYKNLGKQGGFIDRYNDGSYTPMHMAKTKVMVCLGGIAANDFKYGITDTGGISDLSKAFRKVKDLITDCCVNGLHLYSYGYGENSPQLQQSQEQAVANEVDKFYRKVKQILGQNAEFLDALAAALTEKRMLVAADIQQIKRACKIVPVAL